MILKKILLGICIFMFLIGGVFSFNQTSNTFSGVVLETNVISGSSSDVYVLDEIVNSGFDTGLLLSQGTAVGGAYSMTLDKSFPIDSNSISLFLTRNGYSTENLGTGSIIGNDFDLTYSTIGIDENLLSGSLGGVFLCNGKGGCSSFLPALSWQTGSYIKTTVSGFNMELQTKFDVTTGDHFVLDEIVNSGFDTGDILSQATQVGGVYDIVLPKPYSIDTNNLELFITRSGGYTVESLGTGSLVNEHLDMTYSTVGVTEDLFSNSLGGVILCNDNGGCSSFLPALSWQTGSYGESILSGLYFWYKVKIEESLLPVYDSSVPTDNFKTLDTDFFFSIDLGGNVINGAWLNFSNVLYPMNCNSILCNVSISDVSPGEHSYYVIYDFAGTNYSLSSQSMEIFSTDSSGGAVPAFGGLSYLIFTLIFGLGSMFSLRVFKE